MRQKTKKHYKTLDNAFLRNHNKNIYSRKYNLTVTGAGWYNSGYYRDRHKKCTLIYNDIYNSWELCVL